MHQIQMVRNGVEKNVTKVFGNLIDALSYAQQVITMRRGDRLSISIVTSEGIDPLVCSWHSENSIWIYRR